MKVFYTKEVLCAKVEEQRGLIVTERVCVGRLEVYQSGHVRSLQAIFKGHFSVCLGSKHYI